MQRIAAVVITICVAAEGLAQSGFDADLHDPAPGACDLLTVRSARIVAGRASARLGSGWSYHLFGIQNHNESVRWIVRHRLDLWAAVNYSPSRHLRLAAGYSAPVMQEGTRTTATGAEVPLTAAAGPSWLSATWAPVESGNLSAALQTSLGLPTAAAEGLSGDREPTVEVSALFEARLDWFRVLANLGLTTRTRTSFYDLTRDDAIIYRVGIQAMGESWPLGLSAEISGQSPLDRPFSDRTNEFMESFCAIRVKFGPLGVTAGAGVGLLGATAPAVRIILLLDLTGGGKKSGGSKEYE